MSDQDLCPRVAALRSAGQFREAYELFKRESSSAAPEDRQAAMLQAFHAAREGSMAQEARELAHEIAKQEPDLPAIQEYLD